MIVSNRPEVETLSIRTLGGLTIDLEREARTATSTLLTNQTRLHFRTRTIEALLVYLASQRRPISRDLLAEMLWPERTQEQARSNLRVAIHRLREQLDPYVVVTRQHVALNIEVPVAFDAAQFEAHLAAGELEAATALYHGEFLEGFYLDNSPEFEHWALLERERLRALALAAWQQLVEQQVAAGELDAAVESARQLLMLDPLHEPTHRQLMRLLANGGQRSAALAQYEVCRQLFASELDALPDDATTILYEQIREGTYDILATSASLIDGHAQSVGAGTIKPFVTRSRYDWGEAPSVDRFHGRNVELAQLRRWLVDDRCRLVAVLGMGGIGKTALATLAAEEVQEQFTAVIWHSLRNAPPLTELLRQWIQALSRHGIRELPRDEDQQLALLLEYLRRERCLLVLDNFETVLAGEHPGHYLPGFEGYGQLLKQFGEGRHKSCLLLTSREKPRELIRLEGQTSSVRALAVAGLPLADGRLLLQDCDLRGSVEDWGTLHARYSGNPLALQIVSESIRELFASDIGLFLQQESFLFGDIADLLAQQHARMSAMEQDVMFWLAVAREPATPEELAADIMARPTEAAVLVALHALRHRFLVERTETGFTLQNVVLEYFTAVLIEQACKEITTGSMDLLQRIALVKASAKSYVQESQRSLILGPIAGRLVRQLGPHQLMKQFNTILAQLRHTQRRHEDYAGGNILNLMVQAGLDLRGQDFSQLPLRYADLRNVVAQDVNFRRSHLSECAFTDTFASVSSVAFSPDGQHIAAATFGGEIRVWQASDGKPLVTWAAHRGWVASVCFSPDSGVLASASGDYTVRLWNVHNGSLLTTLRGHTNYINCASFSPDGGILASGSDDQTVRLWDRHSGECLRVLQGHTNFVHFVCFSPDGNVIASGGEDQTIRLWDRCSGECLRVLRGHTSFVRSACFSPDGNVIATGSDDKTIRLWDSHSGACLSVREGHTNVVTSVCFGPDGNVLASGSGDHTVRLWDCQSGECLSLLQGHAAWVFSVCFSPDGNVLASGGYDQTVRLWDSHTGACLRLLQGHTNSVNDVSFSPDGDILASVGYDQTLRLWDSHTGACLRLLQGHTGWVWFVCFSPDGGVIASGSDDQTIRLWDSHTGECTRVLRGHTGWVWPVCFSPDGSILASGGYDQTIRLWDSHTGECTRVLQGHANAVPSISFSPDGSILASAGYDQTIRLWDPYTGECLRLLEGHTGWVRSVRFSPDGNLLASGGDDQTIRLWDPHTGESLCLLQGHTNWVATVCFSPDGNFLASGGCDHELRLWAIHTGECLHVLQGHTGWIGSVCFSPDGSVLASCSDDETIRLWDAGTCACLKILRIDRPYERMNITGATGLTPTQVATLKRLGAVDDADLQMMDDPSSH